MLQRRALLVSLVFVVKLCCEDGLLDLDTIPKYVWYLGTIFLSEMRAMKERGTLWLNHNELSRMEFGAIKALLFGSDKLFDVLSIEKESIPSVQHFQWTIVGDAYEELTTVPVSEYIVSPEFTYYVETKTDTDCRRIFFHFRFYRQYSVENPQCAIFLEITKIPDEVKRLRIEIDMKCNKKRQFRQLLRARVLDKDHQITGFVTFPHQQLDEEEEIEWMFAMKILNTEAADVDEGYLKDLYQIFEFEQDF